MSSTSSNNNNNNNNDDLLSGNFKFVLIPYDENLPIKEIEESKSGGLTDDKLIQYARNYFGPNVICDIAAITIPLPQNDYTAVSLYHVGSDGGSDGSSGTTTTTQNNNNNKRAMELIVGCGMNMVITGDVFVGRCIDNEIGDNNTWERIDFTIHDTDPSSEWCEVARRTSNNNRSSSTPSSLSGILQQQLNPINGTTTSVIQGQGQQQQQQQQTTVDNNTFGKDGNYVTEEWGIWSQTDDEIELKFIVPIDTKSKDIQVKFSRNKLMVVNNNVSSNNHNQNQNNLLLLLEGRTFDPIDVDECTYTIQTETNNGQESSQHRELCITLIKQNTGVTWPYTVK